MHPKSLEDIKDTQEYSDLIKARGRIIWPLTLVMLVVYFSFILVIAFFPELLAIKIYDGSHVSYGLIAGLAIIFFSFAITGIYVHKATSVLEKLISNLHNQVGADHE